jgi:SAM-dependent methyltransferase
MNTGRFDSWAETYDESALQPAYQAAHEAVLHVLPRRLQPVRLLDIGCGTGQLLERLAPVVAGGSALIGIDTSVGMLGAAGDRLARSGHLVRAAAEALPFTAADDGVAVIADLARGADLAVEMIAADLEIVSVARVHGYGPVAIVDLVVGRRRRHPRWRFWTWKGPRHGRIAHDASRDRAAT